MSVVLVIGATGSIGRYAVNEAISAGHQVRVLLREKKQISLFPGKVEISIGDLTIPASLREAVEQVDAIVFTHGTHGAEARSFEQVDYGGVKNVLECLNGRKVHIAHMTAIGVTVRSVGHDWKRRAERLIRASGCPYTIVRPGWFDYNAPDELQLLALQGDNRREGSPKDGVISRRQIAQVLINSLSIPEAAYKTFELVAERGPATQDFQQFFTLIEKDDGRNDGVLDRDNMPLTEEPQEILTALNALANV